MARFKEIERKFLLKVIPDNYRKFPRKLLVQGYLVIGNDNSEVRIRKEGRMAYLTVKSSGDLSRQEREIKLTPKQFRILWPLTKGFRIKKVRYRVKLGRKIAYLDIYKGKLKGLKTVEVEFSSIKEAKKSVLPFWLGREITYDERYKNKNLAIFGKPK